MIEKGGGREGGREGGTRSHTCSCCWRHLATSPFTAIPAVVIALFLIPGVEEGGVWTEGGEEVDAEGFRRMKLILRVRALDA